MKSNYPVTRILVSIIRILGVIWAISLASAGCILAKIASSTPMPMYLHNIASSMGMICFFVVVGVVGCAASFLVAEIIVVLADIGDATRETASILKNLAPTTPPAAK